MTNTVTVVPAVIQKRNAQKFVARLAGGITALVFMPALSHAMDTDAVIGEIETAGADLLVVGGAIIAALAGIWVVKRVIGLIGK